ncbi:helix-turn-helix domain-containing protein [Fructilactobacillus sp. Tb1]|uniref:helix-turn-helix domain-containing protein n=1 Tax=Fructilactobacillus sp. Tb1 TaxID=3422304 RepID=UPI003D2BCAEE
MAFGNDLKNLRKEKGFTLRQLAMQANINPGYLSRLENGKQNIPKPETLEKLAKGLRISKEEMFKLAGLEISSDDKLDKYKPEWADENDVLQLDKFLETNGEMTFKGVELNKEQRERVTEVLTQVFWNELKKQRKSGKESK